MMKKTNALFVITSILASSFILKCFYQDSSTRYKITGGHSHQFFRQEIVSGVASTCHIVFQFSPFTCCWLKFEFALRQTKQMIPHRRQTAALNQRSPV